MVCDFMIRCKILMKCIKKYLIWCYNFNSCSVLSSKIAWHNTYTFVCLSYVRTYSHHFTWKALQSKNLVVPFRRVLWDPLVWQLHMGCNRINVENYTTIHRNLSQYRQFRLTISQISYLFARCPNKPPIQRYTLQYRLDMQSQAMVT